MDPAFHHAREKSARRINWLAFVPNKLALCLFRSPNFIEYRVDPEAVHLGVCYLDGVHRALLIGG